MKRIILFCCLLLAVTLQGLAQTNTLIGGLVTDKSSNPLDGVTVTIEGTNKTSLTDAKGKFAISGQNGQILKFIYMGAKTVSVTIGKGNVINVQMDVTATNLNEVVVTGYQKERKKDITGAVAVVNVSEIKDIPVGNPIKALQGRVPGLFITSDGSPSGTASVRVRGNTTLPLPGLPGNDPLYIIDGVQTQRGLQEINQSDIESIQILKDAASASIYGSRAAAGVIIVTTKKSKAGFSSINFDASVSLQFYPSKLKTLNTQERGMAYWQAAVNDKLDPNTNQTYQYDWNKDFSNPVLNRVILPDYLDAAKTMKPANTNWFNEIAQTSVIHSYNLSMANGSEKGNSLFSVSYYDNKGVLRETHDQKITARFNSEYNFFNNRLKIGETFTGTYMKDVLIPSGDVTSLSQIEEPAVPIHTIDGVGWGGPAPGMADRQNPVRLIEDNKQNKNNFGRILGNAYAELKIMPGLNFRTSISADYNGNYARTLRKSYVSGFLSDPTNLVNQNSNYEGNWIFTNTLTYNLQKGKSKLDVLAGQEQVKYINQSFYGTRQGVGLENIDYAYLSSGSTNIDNGGSGGTYALVSFFGKANFAYDDRYLVSLTIRRDGSSRFGANQRYGVFPAISLGWRLSEEGFIKNHVPAISDLKLRYSYGQTGNQSSPYYAPYSLYSAIYGVNHIFGYESGSAYDISGVGTGQLPSGFTQIQQGNDNLKWETTSQSNFGLDFGLFNNTITGSADYFIKNTKDILLTPAYLGVLGEAGNRTINAAAVRNTGFEFLLNYNGRISKSLSFTLTGNIAAYHSKITSLPADAVASYPGNGTDQTILGRSVNSIYGYVADGLFTTQNEVDHSPAQPGKGLGRIRYKDLNGDGVIDSKDQQFLGTTDPDFTYGLNASFSYKRFDLVFFFQGVHGVQEYNTYKGLTDFSSIAPGANWGTRTLSAWTPQNPNSTIPALTTVDRNNEGRTSTYFIENGSYLKLRNIQLGYNLKDVLKSLSVKTARIYLQASNLLTIKSKSYTATDPENPSNVYPIPVIGTMGINFSF